MLIHQRSFLTPTARLYDNGTTGDPARPRNRGGRSGLAVGSDPLLKDKASGTPRTALAAKVLFWLMMLLSDLYRLWAELLDRTSNERRRPGEPRYHVACVANLESQSQLGLMGLGACGRAWSYGLRFSLKGKCGRFLLIRSCANDLETPQGRKVAKDQLRRAIERASQDGAQTVLLAAGTKRLFSQAELQDFTGQYPDMVFTIGDHGTGWALLEDIKAAISKYGIDHQDRVMVIGPTGFLGSLVVDALKQQGYRNLVLVSHREPDSLHAENVSLVIACSHHRDVRLTAEVLTRIGHPRGVHVVDVCKPANLSPKEFARCSCRVSRQDAGNTFNPHIAYTFAAAARLFLRGLRLSAHRMYGCFSEAMAIAHLDRETCRAHDFLHINQPAMTLVRTLLPQQGFACSKEVCFGKSPRRISTSR